MTEWSYLVPKYFESPWHRGAGAVYSADMDWPTVGIYCPHDPVPWLLGSFSISAAVREERGERHWGWRRDFVTGDGYLIRLGRQSPADDAQTLVGTEPHDRGALADQLARVVDQHGPLSPEAAGVMARMERADQALRSRFPLECGVCGLSRRFRSESVQDVLTRLWSVGIREISLELFGARVDRRA